MPRSLTIRKPTAVQVRQLERWLEEDLSFWQRRRAEAVLLYAAGAAGLSAVEIAQSLAVHRNTIYALRGFARLRPARS